MSVVSDWKTVWQELRTNLSRQPKCPIHPEYPHVKTLSTMAVINDMVEIEEKGISVRSHRTNHIDFIDIRRFRTWWDHLVAIGSASLDTSNPNNPDPYRSRIVGAILAACLPDKIKAVSSNRIEMITLNKEIVLTVADAKKIDVGRFVIRLNPNNMANLKLESGDVVELFGTRSVPALAWKGRYEDEERDIIRMDALLRRNAGVSLGDKIRVKKAEPQAARSIQLTLAEQEIKIRGDISSHFREKLLGKPIMQNNVVLLEFLGNVFPFMVTKTKPGGVVIITTMTEIVVREEPVSISETKESEGSESFKYDIAISFASENREIAENLAKKLKNKGIRVFYDKFHKSDLWGKKLSTYFQDVYGPKTRFVIPLISKHYPIKNWTDFEFSIMRREAKKRQNEFILPVRLDDTKMLGIHEDVGYLDYREEGIEGIVECLLEKLS